MAAAEGPAAGRIGPPAYGLFRLFVNFVVVTMLLGAAPARAGAVRLLALGDSLTAGYGLAAADAFPSQLERALKSQGLDVTVINAGVSGDTSAGGLARLDWVLGDHPDAAIVELGANDGLRGLSPTDMYANLDAIVTRLERGGVKVMMCGMLAPPNLGREYGEAFRGAFQRLAAAHPRALFEPFFLDGVAGHPELTQEDGMHPTARGVAVIVGRLLPAVKTLLATTAG